MSTMMQLASGAVVLPVRSRVALAALFAGALAVALVACGGDGGGSSPPPAPVPSPTPSPTPPAPAPAPSPSPAPGVAWQGYAGSAQHTALAGVATQDLEAIVWSTPVDLAPKYTAQGYLLVHYGSPAITAKNTVIVPVKTGATGGFRVEAHDGASGTVSWRLDTDYIPPAHRWFPSYNVTLTASNRLYAPGAGGKVYFRDDADAADVKSQTRVFYGQAAYLADKDKLDAAIVINTPITADAAGTIYFGVTAAAGNSQGLTNSIVRITADGTASWADVASLSPSTSSTKVATNAALALSSDGKVLYVPINSTSGEAYLAAVNSSTLSLKKSVQLMDPSTGAGARVSDDSTAAPTVGPDGDVYFGVLETVAGEHNQRGWLLHFDADLTQRKTPGSFGWDITASVVPASMVPSYKGASSYLLMTKYNNYHRAGSGDGMNRVAVLDPNDTQVDPISGSPVMKEVLSMLGPTPDPNYPAGVTEWCVNTAAVDPFTKSILVNSEDGSLYRWSLVTNTFTQDVTLTGGLGESYTPTAVGPDGMVYAINNARLFAVGTEAKALAAVQRRAAAKALEHIRQ